ncbi:MAG: hypothetical protein Q4Q23_05780 [Methanobacteriaceae archaeon]|nr:hypothetical protein [Methanobacteriaceae archaeon]
MSKKKMLFIVLLIVVLIGLVFTLTNMYNTSDRLQLSSSEIKLPEGYKLGNENNTIVNGSHVIKIEELTSIEIPSMLRDNFIKEHPDAVVGNNITVGSITVQSAKSTVNGTQQVDYWYSKNNKEFHIEIKINDATDYTPIIQTIVNNTITTRNNPVT